MNRLGTMAVSALGLSVLGAAALVVHAGPLSPPAGSVASTYKTLSEVEPRIPISAATTPGDSDGTPSLYKISQPGSYYLTGNITGVSGRIGIEIVASGVTLDLNGYDLVGVAGSLDGIRVTASSNCATVFNGSVRDWDGNGVDVGSSSGAIVHHIRARGNNSSGIYVGTNALVSDCTASFNASAGITNSAGITTGAGSTVVNCSVSGNQGDGINTSSGCTVTNCTVQANGQAGISVNSGSLVSGCAVYNNSRDGIVVTLECVVRDNVIRHAGAVDGSAIHAFNNDNRIEGNYCSNSDIGIEVAGTGNFIAKNTCTGNTVNWQVAAGNVCFVVSAATSAAISGDSGGVSPGSTNPNANYSH